MPAAINIRLRLRKVSPGSMRLISHRQHAERQRGGEWSLRHAGEWKHLHRNVLGVTGDGTLRLDLNSSGTGITDAAGNGISGGYTGGDCLHD